MKKNGFTLIEILIVIAILGILSAMLLGNVFTSQRKARDLQRKSDIRQIGQALELYYQDFGNYPLVDLNGQILGCGDSGVGACEWGESSLMQTTADGQEIIYMALVPADPRAGSYFYDTDADGSYYQLYTRLENEEDKDLMKIDGDNAFYTDTDCGSSLLCNYGLSSTNISPQADHGLTALTPE